MTFYFEARQTGDMTRDDDVKEIFEREKTGSVAFPPTKTLIQQIRRRDWDGARLRLMTYPWDAYYKTRSGNNSTPLHLVCLYRAPLDVVELLLEANPCALLAQDTEGWTPIHLVLLYGGDEEIALLLIRRGGSPAASLQSRFVGSPLHLACRHGSCTRILKELLSANQSMATTPNETGTKPAAFVWNQFVRNPINEHVVEELRQTGEWIPVTRSDDAKYDSDAYSNIVDLLKRVALLLQAAKQDDPEATSVLVHDMVTCQSGVGDMSHFLALALSLFPDQAQYCDERGNFPIHIAASSQPLRRNPYSPRVRDPTRESVEILLKANPQAASIRNRDGMLPLHLALSQGRRTWKTGVSALVDAQSDCLLIRDRVSGLYPYQLAAAFPASDETESVETILQLLLACPHALQYGDANLVAAIS